ncbi:MAG: phosphate ABC transporter ATP-binding protein [Sulfolobales archaeon]|nr:phosphate ABC transporter ATP-binding protein [Sulfolobales archaeon]MCX8185805.1 phosphate ABC transporter ATP-binding protein [Sulfolobales archaeon]MDW7969310.1 phosphate ABC transporter ATP-binding protein [Sulfolobales archaeon]
MNNLIHAVELRNVSIFIGKTPIIKDVNIEIPTNTVYVIMGPSGSGKTTILRLISRLIDLVPEVTVSGTAKVLGMDVLKVNPYVLRRHVGMVFQTPNPFPHMSIYDNVAIAAKINGVAANKEELDEVVKSALTKAMLWDEVKDRLKDYPHTLSGGQKQRLCLARALAMKPKLLLLDEPTASIDPVNARKIEEVIKTLKDEITVIMVTHSPHQAARVGEYVALIYNGGVIEQGSVRDMFLNPRTEFASRFLRGEI